MLLASEDIKQKQNERTNTALTQELCDSIEADGFRCGRKATLN